MPSVIVVCDRCKTEVHGYQDTLGTSGFHKMVGVLRNYRRDGEAIICDDCMSADLAHRPEGECLLHT